MNVYEWGRGSLHTHFVKQGVLYWKKQMHIITGLPTSKLFWYGKLIFSKKIGSWTVPESSVAVVVKCSAIRGGDGKVLRQRGGDSGKLLPAVRGLIKKLVDAEVLHTSWGVPPPPPPEAILTSFRLKKSSQLHLAFPLRRHDSKWWQVCSGWNACAHPSKKSPI